MIIIEKTPILDPNLIKKFSDQINSGRFGLLFYKNRNGKNDYSAVCSSMDWIKIAVDYINEFSFSNQNDNIISMELFSFIMAADIIYSCIVTLHRIIFNKQKETPFNDCNDIFNMLKDDNKYFKNIRAAFGAHPTDLTERHWEIDKFASWSVTRSDNYDFAVYLYSSIPDEGPEEFGFNFKELVNFVKQRYEYLRILIEQIKDEKRLILESFKKKKINKSESIEEYILNLKEAAKERYGEDTYFYAIKDIEDLLKAPCSYEENSESVDKYKEYLYEALDKIHANMQDMSFEKEPCLDIINPSYCPVEIMYDIEKIYECLRPGSWTYGMIDYHLNRLIPYLSRVNKISSDLGIDELYLLVNMGLFFKQTEEDNKKSY